MAKRKKSLSEYSAGQLVLYRFRKNKLAMFGVFLVAVMTLLILLGPLAVPDEAVVKMDIANRFSFPGENG